MGKRPVLPTVVKEEAARRFLGQGCRGHAGGVRPVMHGGVP